MAVSLSLLAGAGWQFFDDNGNPLSGGLLYTYEAGTATPLATYTDSNGNVANANPIVLDAAGRSANQIWLNPAYSYKFVLKTSLGITVWTEDDVPGYGSSADVTFLQAGTGAVARTVQSKLRDTVSVLDFGAVGDGVTDDAAAIQAAINSLGSVGGTLLFPPGTYRVTTTINANVPVLLDGSTPGSVYQPAQTAAVSIVWGGAVGGDVVRFGGFGTLISGGGIVGIYITGSNTAAYALRIKDLQRAYFRNVTLTGATSAGLLLENTGALADPTGFMIFDDLRIQLRGGGTDNARGIYVNGAGTGVSGVTLCTFRRCRIDHANGAGVEVSNIGDFFYWESLQTFRADVETGQGVWFSGTSPTAICGGHTFMAPNASSGFRFDTPNVQTQTRIINAGQIDINPGIQMLYGNGAGDVVMDTGLGFAYGQGLLNPIHAFSQRDNMALIRWDSANNMLHTAQGNWKTAVTAGGSIIESGQPGSATRLVTNAGLNDTAAIYDNATIGGGDGFSPATSFAGDFLVSLIQLTNEVVRFGFSNSTGDSPSNAVYVEFDPSVNANWRFVSTKAGVTTSVVSPLAGFVGKIEFYIFVEQFSNGVTCYFRTAGNRLFGLLGKITTNVPLLPMSTFVRIKTTDANFKSFDVYGIKTAAVDEV